MERVWILQRGEMNDGGQVLGVFEDREGGRKRMRECMATAYGFDPDAPLTEESDGTLSAYAGSDWFFLEPQPVIPTD